MVSLAWCREFREGERGTERQPSPVPDPRDPRLRTRRRQPSSSNESRARVTPRGATGSHREQNCDDRATEPSTVLPAQAAAPRKQEPRSRRRWSVSWPLVRGSRSVATAAEPAPGRSARACFCRIAGLTRYPYPRPRPALVRARANRAPLRRPRSANPRSVGDRLPPPLAIESGRRLS